MPPERHEMRNDALSRIGLPKIPVEPASQVSEWKDDETTLVPSSATLSMSSVSSDTYVDSSDTEDEFSESDEGMDGPFAGYIRDYIENVNRVSRTVRNFLDAVVEVGSIDLSSELQTEDP